jgi:hypothetical protein
VIGGAERRASTRIPYFDRVPELPNLPCPPPGSRPTPGIYCLCDFELFIPPPTTTATNPREAGIESRLLRIHGEEGAQGRRRARGRRRAVRLRPLRHRGGQRRRPRLPHRRLVRSEGSLFYHSSSSAIFSFLFFFVLLAVTHRRPPLPSRR